MLAQPLDSMGQFSTLDEMRGGYDESPVTTDLRSESGPESDTWDRLPAGRDHKLSANNNSTITSMLFKVLLPPENISEYKFVDFQFSLSRELLLPKLNPEMKGTPPTSPAPQWVTIVTQVMTSPL